MTSNASSFGFLGSFLIYVTLSTLQISQLHECQHYGMLMLQKLHVIGYSQVIALNLEEALRGVVRACVTLGK